MIVPTLATLEFVVDGSDADGCLTCDPGTKVEMQDITCDSNAARSRRGGLNDGTVTASFIEDDDDTGQDKIRASKQAKTALGYVVTNGGTLCMFTAYVERIKRSGGPGDIQKMDVTFAVSGTGVYIVVEWAGEWALDFTKKYNAFYLVVI